MTELLAMPGKYGGWKTPLGWIMHGSGKQLLRAQIALAHGHYQPVLDYKRSNGWIKDHVACMDEGFKWIISLDDQPINYGEGRIGGFSGPNDKNRVMFNNIFDIFALMMDEDTHYDMRVLLWLKWIHEHWDRFEQSAQQAYQIMNFHNLYKELLNLAEPLPNIGAEPEEEEFDGEELEAKANVGK